MITLAASGLASTSMVANASVNPNGASTTVYFQFGQDTNYGSFTATNALAAGSSFLPASNTISYLFPGAPYHFRAVAQNSQGTGIGADMAVTLPGVTNFTVTSTNDAGPGTLRDAIGNAANGSTISFAVTGTITLTSALPVIFKSLAINGPGVSNLTISGNGSNRIFFVDAVAGAASFNNLTLANGRAKGGNGGRGRITRRRRRDGAGGALFVMPAP